ncbi:hypothetical protein P280DRAFT_259950 [Massarina eburnea CBS 473.64]|uniref:Uncharacterized protein n=1 Tax=Massarina eburnea CBS 473.64 TaxID=1395130 RepID=A0A6A6RH92_9PLEO|nr:hypothetical protein P280DRAFT_259950 [Massarina eburnea CBS 473.64]
MMWNPSQKTDRVASIRSVEFKYIKNTSSPQYLILKLILFPISTTTTALCIVNMKTTILAIVASITALAAATPAPQTAPTLIFYCFTAPGVAPPSPCTARKESLSRVSSDPSTKT